MTAAETVTQAWLDHRQEQRRERARTMSAARDDLLASLDGLELTVDEQKTVDWLLAWDQPTLNAIADIIRKARHAGEA